MATKRKFATGAVLRVTVASPTKSNDPLVYGELGGGVAITDYDARDSKATVDFTGVYTLSVKAVNDAGNVAVAEGDALYFVTGDVPVLSKKTSGVFWGYALAPITSGATASIDVRSADGARSSARAPFVSTEQTATGSAQNVAHGFGTVPSAVAIILTEFLSNQSIDVTEGAHSTTNVVVTIASGVKFKVLAWK